jgi:hypothetical protein
MTDDRPIDITTGKPVMTDDERLAHLQSLYEEFHPEAGDDILDMPVFAKYRDRIKRIEPRNNITSMEQFKKNRGKK